MPQAPARLSPGRPPVHAPSVCARNVAAPAWPAAPVECPKARNRTGSPPLPADHWPALPTPEPEDDWEQTLSDERRQLERRQRLDREQRGSSWNM